MDGLNLDKQENKSKSNYLSEIKIDISNLKDLVLMQIEISKCLKAEIPNGFKETEILTDQFQKNLSEYKNTIEQIYQELKNIITGLREESYNIKKLPEKIENTIRLLVPQIGAELQRFQDIKMSKIKKDIEDIHASIKEAEDSVNAFQQKWKATKVVKIIISTTAVMFSILSASISACFVILFFYK